MSAMGFCNGCLKYHEGPRCSELFNTTNPQPPPPIITVSEEAREVAREWLKHQPDPLNCDTCNYVKWLMSANLQRMQQNEKLTKDVALWKEQHDVVWRSHKLLATATEKLTKENNRLTDHLSLLLAEIRTLFARVKELEELNQRPTNDLDKYK